MRVLGALAAAAVVLAAPGVTVDRTVRDPRISEDSALAASALHAGILWTLNDSGHPPQLFALGRDGRTAATVRVTGTDTDWEALATARDGGGRPLLLVGDIGDNLAVRPSVQVVVVREPARLRDATVRPARTLRLTYPDGPRDAEALFVGADRRLYLVTKGLFTGSLYVVPAAAWPGDQPTSAPVVLRRLADVPLGLVTDAVALPDGRVLLRTYGEVAVMPPPDRVLDDVWRPQAQAQAPDQPQGEGLALDAARPGTLLLSTEGVRQPVLRWRPDGPLGRALAGVAASPTATTPTTPTASTPTSQTSAAAAPAAAAPGGDVAFKVAGWLTGGLALLALGLLFRSRVRHHRRG